jgi:hypothetical protein
MEVYKIELMVIDSENIGRDEIEFILRYSKINPVVLNIDSRTIEGGWSDYHPLNKKETFKQELERIFSK